MQHAWRIESREYERHESRRGRRHAFETIDPARTALAVIDMVPFFVEANPYTAGGTSCLHTGPTSWSRVADANSAGTDEDLNATLHTVYRSFGDVRPTAELLDLIER